MTGATIRVDHLSKSYRVAGGRRAASFPAVEDVSFEVGEGQCLAVVGESGSGKSTIGKLLVGLERATAGTIAVCGRDRTEPVSRAALRRERGAELQIVFQDPYTSLDPRQRVRDSIDEVLALHARGRLGRGSGGRGGETARIAELVGIDERLLDVLPRTLSGGQRQRVAIAKALAAAPRAIVLDEAVSALDVSIQAQVLNVLNHVRAETGVSYVFITHDLAVVRQVADHVLVLRRGRQVEFGTVDDLLGNPREEYTRRLIDAVPKAVASV